MQIANWGNSLVVRIPADVARTLGLKVGDDVELRAMESGELAVITEWERRAAAMQRLRELRGTAPPGFKFHRRRRTPDDHQPFSLIP